MALRLLAILVFIPTLVQAQTDCLSCATPSMGTDISKKVESLVAIAQKANCSSPDNTKNLKSISLKPTPNLSDAVTWKSFGEEFDSFYGVPAYSNKSTGGGKYQCTEVVHRFLNHVFDIPTRIGMGMGNGDTLAKNVSHHFKNTVIQNEHTGNKKARLAYIENGCSKQAPVVGSVVSIKFKTAPHVAVIRDVKVLDENHIEVVLFEQHGIRRISPGSPKPRTKMKLTKASDGTWSGPNMVGWITVVEE